MWSRKTRALCWQIGEDGHCCTENEMPNLLWRFPWAPLWRSAQGCDGTIQNKLAGLRHTQLQTQTSKKELNIEIPRKKHYIKGLFYIFFILCCVQVTVGTIIKKVCFYFAQSLSAFIYSPWGKHLSLFDFFLLFLEHIARATSQNGLMGSFTQVAQLKKGMHPVWTVLFVFEMFVRTASFLESVLSAHSSFEWALEQ